MRTQAANQRPSMGISPSVRNWAQACRGWLSSGGPRTKVTDGAASRA